MRINIVYNNRIDGYKEVLELLESKLIEKKVDFQSCNIDNLKAFGEFTVVIGGDGSILKAAKFYTETPVLGINLGRLGFLSQAGVKEIEDVIKKIVSKKYSVEKRIMLESNNSLALNDFVIKGCQTSRTSKFYLEINNKFVSDYIADGLIISTPTGSTAYGLSAGGPVLYPTLDALVIVPICPHTLNARPLVVPCTETITIKTDDKPLSVSVDGFEADNCVNELSIKVSDKKAFLAFLNDDSFYSVLRKKLHWGISILRNGNI